MDKIIQFRHPVKRRGGHGIVIRRGIAKLSDDESRRVCAEIDRLRKLKPKNSEQAPRGLSRNSWTIYFRPLYPGTWTEEWLRYRDDCSRCAVGDAIRKVASMEKQFAKLEEDIVLRTRKLEDQQKNLNQGEQELPGGLVHRLEVLSRRMNPLARFAKRIWGRKKSTKTRRPAVERAWAALERRF